MSLFLEQRKNERRGVEEAKRFSMFRFHDSCGFVPRQDLPGVPPANEVVFLFYPSHSMPALSNLHGIVGRCHTMESEILGLKS